MKKPSKEAEKRTKKEEEEGKTGVSEKSREKRYQHSQNC